LDLFDCKSIESLPTTIVHLKHLTQLLLGGCENLKELPQTIGNISSLSILDLSRCKSIESLPTTIVHLKHLTELKFGGCEILRSFLKSLEASLHYQYWINFIAGPLNHYQQQVTT
jgi:leucine-rich repeat protein SHOC2